jgi:hypothetical protein
MSAETVAVLAAEYRDGRAHAKFLRRIEAREHFIHARLEHPDEHADPGLRAASSTMPSSTRMSASFISQPLREGAEAPRADALG